MPWLSVIVELRDIDGTMLRFELQLMQRSIVSKRFLMRKIEFKIKRIENKRLIYLEK